MWADRAVWLCLVGFLTAELMAQAALSFNGSNYLQPPPFLVPTDSPPSKLCNCGLWHFCLSLPMTVMVSLRFNIKQFHISFSGKRCTMLSKKWPGQYQILLYQPNWPPCVDQYTLCVDSRSHCVFFNLLPPPPPVDQRTNCVARGSVVPGPLLY